MASAGGGGSVFIEAFPTSPLILSPFTDPLPIPKPMVPTPKAEVDTWSSPPGPDNQDFVKGAAGLQAPTLAGRGRDGDVPVDRTTPDVYQIKLQVAGHDFTTSMVQPINSPGKNITPPGNSNSRAAQAAARARSTASTGRSRAR